MRILNRIFICVLLSITSVLPLSAAVEFEGLDLSLDNRLLFKVNSGGNGAYIQSALFSADPQNLSLRQLSAFPEKLDVLENGRTLQIRNALGAVRVPISGGLPRKVSGFPSFGETVPALDGRVEDMAPSSDGRWILYVEPVSAAYGNLVLIDVSSGSRYTVSENIERPGQYFPASWSPDSKVFIYSRSSRLYYHSVPAATSSSVEERYRLIGDGSLKSIYWGNAGDFFYINSSVVYRVRTSELFARALYADFLEIGQVAGKIPFGFDPNFDEFWVAPDSRSMLLSKGNRNIFYYPLGTDDYYADFEASLPYVMLPRSCTSLNLLWSPSGLLTLIVHMPQNGNNSSVAYRLDVSKKDGMQSFTEIQAPMGSRMALSPDGTRALIWGNNGAALYDYINWKELSLLSDQHTLHAQWLGNEEFVLADADRIIRVNRVGVKNLVCLSDVDSYGFDENSNRILARNRDNWFSTDGVTPWRLESDGKIKNPSAVSEKFRVYLEQQSGGPYKNIPMIRNIQGLGTFSLVNKNHALYEPIPLEDSKQNYADVSVPFNHGRRSGLREIALIFDIIDEADGLPVVLDTLARFGLRGSFFLNGEFIRRHPAAAKEIAAAGHEVASMFFAPINLADGRYSIDHDFIRRGLARNEDEFFQMTGYELRLLWHAPYYGVSSEMIEAAASVGYRTIGRDIDPLDWVGRSTAQKVSLPYYSASEIVDRIMDEKKPGSILPIRLGIPEGGRDDYLFSRLDVLLDALVRSGYSIVPVSTLIEHAR